MFRSTIFWVTLAALALLLAMALPPLLTRRAVSNAAHELAAAVRTEDMHGIEARILSPQRQLARELIQPLLPGHGSSLKSFRITAAERLGDGSYELRTVFSFDDASWGRQIIEARMRMQQESGNWMLDLVDCEARQFSISGEGGWTKATDWLNLTQP